MGPLNGGFNLITIVRCCAILGLLMFLDIDTVESAKPTKPKTVQIGVIVDGNDDRSAAINKSVDVAMSVSNYTEFVRMNPQIKETDIRDNFKLRETFCTLIDRKPIALIGTSVSQTFDIVQSYSRALTIPFFLPSLTRESNLHKDNYIISMCPSFINAVIDFIRRLQWDRIFYLFDTDDALWRLQKLYTAFQSPVGKNKTPFLIDAIRIPDVRNCREVLRKLDRNYNFDNKRIIVDLYSLQEYDSFLSQIIDVGMNRDGYHYLLGTLGIKSMNIELWRSFTYGGVNITGFQLINRNKWNYLHETIYSKLEMNREPSVEVALSVDAVAVLTNAFQRIMMFNSSAIPWRRGNIYLDMNCSDPISNLEIGPLILHYIRQTGSKGPFNGLSGKIAFDENLYRKDYTLDIYQLSYRSPLKKIGFWRDGYGLSSTISGPRNGEPTERGRNSTQVITTVINEPFVAFKRTDHVNGKPLVGNDRFEGYCIDMISAISKKINFTYDIQELKSKKYGSKLEGGAWDGMIGKVLNKSADIALGSISITRKREEVVRFSKPFMNTGISIMIKRPEKEKPGVFSFMEPLSYDVWALILCGFFAVSFILYMVGRFSPYEWQEENSGSGPSDTFSFVNTLWFSLGALMQQGPDIFPRPEKEKPGVFSFMEPLSYDVWALILCGFFAVSFILYMVGRFSPYEWQEENSGSGPSDTFSFVNTLWFSLGALMQQGPDIFPRSLSGRILGSVWWFFTLIIISSYTANLAAFLTFEKLTTQINSVDDLQKQTSVKYGCQKPGATFDFFKESNVTVYQKMFDFMKDQQPSVFVDKPRKGWEKVISSKGKYAFLLESSSNQYFNQRKPCKTMMVGRNLDEKGYGIATRKDSTLAHRINIAVLEMRENGDLLKMEQKWWYSKGECGTADGGDKLKSALNLSNVSGIFHILIGGLVLSMIISLSQIVFHTKLRSRTRRNNYTVNNSTSNHTSRPYRAPRKVTIEESPVTPVITCTTSNGGEPHLISFDDPSDQGIISLDSEVT